MKKYIALLCTLVFALSASAQNLTLSEGFEGWDGKTQDWLPTGWTVKKSEGLPNYYNSWYVSGQANAYAPAVPEGKYYAEIIFTSKAEQDEWLITPSFTVKANEELAFKIGVTPFNLLNWDSKYFDWNTKTFKEKIIAADFQVLICEEEGEWTQVLSLFERYSQYDDTDLYKNYRVFDFYNESVDLSAYIGKKVRVAFRYVGCDGDSMFLDAITVSEAPVTAAYHQDGSTLQWVYGEDFNYPLTYGVHVVSPYGHARYVNDSDESATEVNWISKSINNGSEQTSSEKEVFEVCYKPDYSTGEFQNLYYAPTLTVAREGARSAEYMDSTYPLVMVGGTAEISGYKFGVSNYRVDDDYRLLGEEIDGRIGVPRYGYAEGTDLYWTQNNSSDNIDYQHLVGVGHRFEQPEKPIVIKGGWMHAYAEFNDNAQFQIEIFEYDVDGNLAENPAATCTIKAKETLREYSDSKGIVTIPFNFKTPYVQTQTILLVLKGFHDADNVSYFGAYQTKKHREDQSYGYAILETKQCDGTITTDYDHAISQDEDPLGGTCFNSFLFALDAEFPWLELQEKNKENLIGDDLCCDVYLDSYYPADQLKVESSPECWSNTFEGQYDKTVMHVTAMPTAKQLVETLQINANGVLRPVTIQQSPTTGISAVSTSPQETPEIYNLSGQRIQNASNGVFVINKEKRIK